ncbi:MAG: hypothetical protein M1608_11345 [Candidatus Omnitrophica bacterium]|nr:hypothetical protein [Candidatus Omnitrophota bacterium]
MKRWLTAAGASVLWIESAWLAFAWPGTADRIHISGGTNQVVLPGSNRGGPDWRMLDGPLHPKVPTSGPGGVPYVLPAPSAPLALPNPRLQEFIDRQKNWIYVTPDMLNETSTPDEAFNVREIRLDGREDDSKKTITRYLEKHERDQSTRTNDLQSKTEDYDSQKPKPDSTVLSPAGSEPSGALYRSESGLSNKLEMNRWFSAPSAPWGNIPGNPLGSFDTMSSPSLVPAGGYSDRARELQIQADERFERLLRPGDVGSPLNRNPDMINLFGDSTAKDLQPVTSGSGADLLKSTPAANPLNPLSGIGNPNRPLQSGILEDLNKGAFGSSSLSPALDLPSKPQSVQPMPTFPGVPLRKF